MKKGFDDYLFIAVAWGGVFVLGGLDWLSGYELNFFVFYFLPVSAAAWYLGRRASIGVALLSALIWYLVNDFGLHHSTLHAYAAWNTIIRLVAFLYIGITISHMRALLVREHEVTAAFRQAMSEIKVLHGILPICAQCKKIRNEAGAWEQMEAYISEHSESQFSHGYCPECAQKLRAEAGLADKELQDEPEDHRS